MSVSKPGRVSAQTLARIRDYVVNEPSFTIAFAAWELELSPSAIGPAVEQLLGAGVIEQIEPRNGPYAAVYAYVSPKPTPRRVRSNGRLFAELDDSRVGELRPANSGAVVPHTRIRGTSDSPGLDRKRQEAGVRLSRGKGRG
jgi:hypothetical protein